MSHSVLLCDDEPHILRAAEIKFKRAGYDVRCATDGEFAWEEILRDCPDLLITDYQMPRLDGLGLVERVRNCEAVRDLPVLMLTAKGFEISAEEVLRKWGVAAVLPKPFSPRELESRALQILTTANTVSSAIE
jgi:two-component system alkaline phosphatase synthesis response regulator PhoP